MVICALALPLAAAGAELLGAAGLLAGADEEPGADGEEAGALADGPPAVELEPLLLHAAAVAVRARPITGTAIRRARSWNRITRLLGALS